MVSGTAKNIKSALQLKIVILCPEQNIFVINCENDMLREGNFRVENGGLSRGTYMYLICKYNLHTKCPPPPLYTLSHAAFYMATIKMQRSEAQCESKV